MTLFQLLRLLPESTAFIIVDQQGIEIVRGKVKSDIPQNLFEYDILVLQSCLLHFDGKITSAFCIQLYK